MDTENKQQVQEDTEKQQQKKEQEDKQKEMQNKQHMTYIQMNMPDVWKMIVSTRCCPIHLRLQKFCELLPGNPERSCEDCWKAAIQLDNPVLITDGKYYCPKCKKELSVSKIENGQQEWECKSCKKLYVVPTAPSK